MAPPCYDPSCKIESHICYSCGEHGHQRHMSEDCPQLSRKKRKSDSSDDLSRASMSTNADEKMEMVEKECEEWKAKSKDLEEKYRELQGQLQWAKKDSEEKASVAKRKYELLERSHEMLKKETTGDKDLKERCCMLEGESEAVARKNEELEKKVEKLKATLKYLL